MIPDIASFQSFLLRVSVPATFSFQLPSSATHSHTVFSVPFLLLPTSDPTLKKKQKKRERKNKAARLPHSEAGFFHMLMLLPTVQRTAQETGRLPQTRICPHMRVHAHAHTHTHTCSENTEKRNVHLRTLHFIFLSQHVEAVGEELGLKSLTTGGGYRRRTHPRHGLIRLSGSFKQAVPCCARQFLLITPHPNHPNHPLPPRTLRG